MFHCDKCKKKEFDIGDLMESKCDVREKHIN